MNSCLVSIVLPAHNEEDNICSIYSEIRRCLQRCEVEIIFVDDGSHDATAEQVRQLRRTDPFVRLIRLSRNFGHQAALLAGIRASRGAAVITMDCDMQHPPECLPKMFDAWCAGAHVVQMVRSDTRGAKPLKQISSALFYRVMAVLSDSLVTPGAADFQLLDRKVVDALYEFRDRRPFLRGMVTWLGFPTCRIQYVAETRHAGTSSYSLVKMFQLSLDAVTGLSRKPLRMAFYLGAAVAVLSGFYGLFVLRAFIDGKTVAGWTSMMLAILFLGAVQLISIGILGEYIGRVYDQTRQVPPFVVLEGDSHPTIAHPQAERDLVS